MTQVLLARIKHICWISEHSHIPDIFQIISLLVMIKLFQVYIYIWDNFCVISVLMPPQFIHERDCCYRQHPLKICWNYCISEHCLAEHLTNHMWTLQWAEQFCQQLPERKIGQGVSSSMGTKKAATWSSVLQKITTKKLENIKLFEFSVTVFHLVVGFLVWFFFFSIQLLLVLVLIKKTNSSLFDCCVLVY